ncbi:hypothetical protein D3C83_79320 [compost metagenome]
MNMELAGHIADTEPSCGSLPRSCVGEPRCDRFFQTLAECLVALEYLRFRNVVQEIQGKQLAGLEAL